MSVLGALLRGSLESPDTPLSSAHLAEWARGARSKAGVSVTEKRVYGLPSYYRAIAVKAGTLATLPVKPFHRRTRQPVLTPTVLDNPNPRQTEFEFWFTTYANAISWGNAYGFKFFDGMGIVREVWPIHPSRVTPWEVDTSAENPAGKVFQVRFPDGREGWYTPRDVFHIPYMSLDGISGIRPLDLFRTSLGTAIAADESAAGFYANGSMISGVLTTDADLGPGSAKADALKRAWKSKVAGPDNAGEIAVLDNGAKFMAISLKPGDAQLLESRKWSVSEMARMVGVLPHMIGDTERSTSWGTGIEQQTLGWVKFDIQGWVNLVEQRCTRELLPGGWNGGSWYAETSLQALLRGDSKARAEFYRVMVTIGAMKLTRVQELENEVPDELVDFYTVPKNMTIVRDEDDTEDPDPNGGRTNDTNA